MAYMEYYGNLITAPEWMGDFGSRDHLRPVPGKLDYTQFKDALGIAMVVAAGGAAQGATSIPVAALAYPFTSALTAVTTAANNRIAPAGAVLDFGGAKFATLTADAFVGDTTLAVRALPTALVAGDLATYSPGLTDLIPSGTIVGRTYAQRAANAPYGPAVAGTSDQIYIVAFDVANAFRNGDCEFYRPPSLVKENYLPGYSTILNPGGTPSALLTKLRTLYDCIIGVD